MTTHPNETPEPLAGAMIKDSLKVAEPLAQGQAGEMPVVAWMKVSKKHAPRMCMLSEAYVQGVWDVELVRLSDHTAALQAKDAEIARLKADAGRYQFIRRRKGAFVVEHHRPGWATCYGPKELDAAIDAAMKGEAA